MDKQRIRYQRDKEGNVKRIRVIAENTDILCEEIDKIPDEWHVFFQLRDEKENRTIKFARYGKDSLPLKGIKMAIREKLAQGETSEEAFFYSISWVDINANSDSDDEELIRYQPSDITSIVVFAEEREPYLPDQTRERNARH